MNDKNETTQDVQLFPNLFPNLNIMANDRETVERDLAEIRRDREATPLPSNESGLPPWLEELMHHDHSDLSVEALEDLFPTTNSTLIGANPDIEIVPASGNLGPCCSKLVVFALAGGTRAKGAGHIDFRKGTEVLIQRMQGRCRSITTKAVLITEVPDPVAFDDWQGNVDNVISDGGEITFVAWCRFGFVKLPYT